MIAGASAFLALPGCGFLADDESGTHGDEIENYERGTLEVVVDGEPIDLSADRFQAEHADEYSIDFHFHEFDDYWYMEGDRVTFAGGIDRLPHFAYEETVRGHVVTADGTTYDEADEGTAIEFEANGKPVDPTEYDVRDGDELRVEIETDG